MIQLAFEKYAFKTKEEAGITYLFDIIRKKYVKVTPEEWVRQHIIWYLIEKMEYPKSLISVEKKIEINGLPKRYDIIVYDSQHKPWMLIECKEPNVMISDKTLQQLLQYQRTIQCPYGVMTNGKHTYCCQLKIPGFSWLTDLPVFLKK